MGDWRKLHNEELHKVYSSLSIVKNIKSRWMKWAKYIAHMEEIRSVYRDLFGRLEGTRQLVRHRRQWEDNIIMELSGTGRDCVTRIRIKFLRSNVLEHHWKNSKHIKDAIFRILFCHFPYSY
jgi:hypothetical protein